MGGANNMPTGGGNNGFFGGNAPSSGNVGSGKGTSSAQSSAPSSYLPQTNTQMMGYSNSLQQPSYGPPPSSYYQPQSQQSYGGMGSSKGTSQPAYGGTGYNTPRLPQMVQPQSIGQPAPGSVYGGPTPTAYPGAPRPIPGAVYSGPAPEDFNAAPTINRAPIVEAPPAPAPAPTPTPDQTSAPEPAPNPLTPARYDDEGRAYNSQGQQIRWDENGNYSLVGGEKRGGRIEAKSTDTVDRALSLVRNVAKKDKK